MSTCLKLNSVRAHSLVFKGLLNRPQPHSLSFASHNIMYWREVSSCPEHLDFHGHQKSYDVSLIGPSWVRKKNRTMEINITQVLFHLIKPFLNYSICVSYKPHLVEARHWKALSSSQRNKLTSEKVTKYDQKVSKRSPGEKKQGLKPSLI